MPYLKSQSGPVNFGVTFRQEYQVVLDLHISNDTLTLELQDNYRPINEIIAWLEAITCRVRYCSCRIDDHHEQTWINAFYSRKEDQITLTFNDGYDNFYQGTVRRYQLIDALYNGLVTFTKSGEYLPERWEHETMIDRIAGLTGESDMTIINNMSRMTSSTLKQTLYEAAPRKQIHIANPNGNPNAYWTKALDCLNDPSNKENQMGLKIIDEEYEIDNRFDEWEIPWRVKYLKSHLQMEVGNFHGEKLRNLRSPIIEGYLDKELI